MELMKRHLGCFEPSHAVEEFSGSVFALTTGDLYDCLNNNSEDAYCIAEYIAAERPDLAGEIEYLLSTYGNRWS